MASYYGTELRKIAAFHEQQAASLERETEFDALSPAAAAARAQAIAAQRDKASSLQDEAAQADRDHQI